MAVAPAGYGSHFARLEHCLQLRREGQSYRQIADSVGLRDERAAQALISKAITRLLKESAEEVRAIELSRLELLITTLWSQAVLDVQGDTPDFRRFDRVKQLLETKLKFCGAQSVMDGAEGGKYGSIQIFIKSFTAHANPAVMPNTALQLADRAPDPDGRDREEIERELAVLLPDDEKPEPYA